MRVFIQTHLFMSKIVHFVESVRRLLQCVWHLIVYNWYCLLHAWTGQRRDLYPPHTLHFMLLPLEREFSKIYQFVIRFLRVEFSSCEPQTWVIKPKLSMKIGRYRHFVAYVKQECICSFSLSDFSRLSAFSSQLSDSLPLEGKRTKDTKRSCLEYGARSRYNPRFIGSFGLITQV